MITEHGRTCADCKEFKFWHEFYKDPSSKLGHQTRCKCCAKDRQKINYYKKVNESKKPTINKFLTGSF